MSPQPFRNGKRTSLGGHPPLSDASGLPNFSFVPKMDSGGFVRPIGRDTVRSLIARLAREEGGQDLIEYGLLAALISVLAVAALTSIGSKLMNTYQGLAAALP